MALALHAISFAKPLVSVRAHDPIGMLGEAVMKPCTPVAARSAPIAYHRQEAARKANDGAAMVQRTQGSLD